MAKRRANGEGSLRRRKDGRWECTFMVGWQDDGRRKTKSFYGLSQEEVLKKAREWKARCTPAMIATKEYFFDEWADMWFALHKEVRKYFLHNFLLFRAVSAPNHFLFVTL